MNRDEILKAIKPYVMGWISQANGRGGVSTVISGSSGAPDPHALDSSHHTGTLGDAQGPQFLKLDGSRTLTGNLLVTDGKTIDGVDLSAHAADMDAHHKQNHDIDGSDHTAVGSAWDVVGLNGTNTLGILSSSSNPGAAEKLLRTSSLGTLTLNSISITNALTAGSVNSSLIPSATDTYDLGSSTKLWRHGYLSELDAVLFAKETASLLGGWLIVGHNAGVLAADIGVPNSVVDFGQTMTPGDFVVFRSIGAVEYMQVGSLYSGTRYNVTRNLDGSGANAWPAGSAYLVLGHSGDGRIELNAYDAPKIQLINQGVTYNASTELMRFGDLGGNWGYTSGSVGIALGEYATGKANMTWDAVNGLRLRMFDQDVIKLGNDGNASFEGDLSMGADGHIYAGSIALDTSGLHMMAVNLWETDELPPDYFIDLTNGKLFAFDWTGIGIGLQLQSDGIMLLRAMTPDAGQNKIWLSVGDAYDTIFQIARGNAAVWGHGMAVGYRSEAESVPSGQLQAETIKAGDITGGNYVNIASDGTLTLNGTATAWDDLLVNMANVRAPASNSPTWTAYKGSEVPAFSKSATNTLYFNVQLPHRWKVGSNIEFHIHIAYPDSGTGNSRWTLTYSWANIGANFAAETSTTVTIAAPGVADRHALAELVATISGTGKTMSSVLLCSISRIGGDAADTYDNVIYLLSSDFHYEIDSFGSAQELVK